MEEQKQQLIKRIKESTNVLVTVSSNPSADQLAAALGFTLALNKLNKHASAVFSGEPPSMIDFLEPEKTFSKNTDSLRDFIISLDRAKADKLRYKVEDKVVKIFISPYRTSIKQDDFSFSQGDFNVDLVVALGVNEQKDLDQAITAHGRILHDATVATVTTGGEGTIGSIHWVDTNASSLSEMMAPVTAGLRENLLDNQIATAFLTGIVAETDQFSNDKTKPTTMSVSSQLMAAGANQKLVSTKLQEALHPPEPVKQPEPEPGSATSTGEVSSDADQDKPEASPQVNIEGSAKTEEQAKAEAKAQADAEEKAQAEAKARAEKEAGILRIDHSEFEQAAEGGDSTAQGKTEDDNASQIHIDEHGTIHSSDHAPHADQASPATQPDRPGQPAPSDQTKSDVKTDDANSSTQPKQSSDGDSDQALGQEHPPIISKPHHTVLTNPPEEDKTDLFAPSSGEMDNSDSTDPLGDAARRNQRILRRDDDNGSQADNHNRTSATGAQPGQADDRSKREGADTQLGDSPNQTDNSVPSSQGESQAAAPPSQSNKPDLPPNDKKDAQTLSNIEKSFGAHQDQGGDASVAPQPGTSMEPTNGTAETPSSVFDGAQQAVRGAVKQNPPSPDAPLPKTEALNAQPVHLNLHPEDKPAADQSSDKTDENNNTPSKDNAGNDTPPSVPPPMMPPSPQQGQQPDQ